ncbi:hypothetical protein IV203_020980 [Nitzschia inconspicua]|uniref:G-protein coupled receptors family 2 profile 2 domain-containing protein n=1 Tax=Nitzschia inconspicua TaxID=303405 RepID=A0A9K3KH14_9STRA|nr:hypothetical protein IV203_020980 [Nitzschia inconspicua]
MEDDYKTLSPSQYKLLTILPIPTAVLSVVGSGAIIYMVARSRRQREWTPYKRLLFGMSACDILLSINAAVGNIMRPEISSPRVWAFGNQATCTASGFLGQLSLSAILYNGGLSFYFLLSARFGWKNDRIAKWVEPLMHVTCIGYPMVTAAIGAGLGVFSEPVMGLGCQINDYPRGCGEGPGKTGEPCLSIAIAWVFVGIPRILNGFAIVLNNLVICVFVWQQARPSKKPEIHKNDDAKAAAVTSDDNSSQCNVECSISPQFQQKSAKSTIEDSFVDHSTIGLRESPRPRDKTVRSTRDSFETDRVSTNLESSSRTARPFRIRNPTSNRPKSLTSIEGDQLRRLQLVRSQAILFVGCYFISNFWIGLTSFLESISPTDADEYAMAAACYPLLIMYAIFVPLQGFFNMLVYMRPKYGTYRTHFPGESRLWAFWLTLTGEDSPKLRNKNKEESLDPYSAQNLAKSGNTTPLPPLNGEEKEGGQVEFSQGGSEVCSPIDASGVLRRSPSHAVHSQTIWTNDEFSPHQHSTEDSQAIVEESKKDVEERPTIWQPIQKSHHFISSLKSSSLEVISEMSEMSFDNHEDDRWKSGSKLSNCSSIPLIIPKRPESLAEPMNRSEDLLEQVHDSLQGPSPKCSLDSPLSCPKRRLSPPPIRTDIL